MSNTCRQLQCRKRLTIKRPPLQQQQSTRLQKRHRRLLQGWISSSRNSSLYHYNWPLRLQCQ
jgi:hypothetical protein